MKRELELIKKINKIVIVESIGSSFRNFLVKIINDGKLTLGIQELLSGSESRKLFRKGLNNLTEDELEFLSKNLNWEKIASNLLQNNIISNIKKINAFELAIQKLKNKTYPSYDEFLKKYYNLSFISNLYNQSNRKPFGTVVPDYVLKIQKEFNKKYLTEFEDYFEKKYSELYKRLKGKTLTDKQIKLLESQLRGKYKFGTINRIWRLAKKTADESLDEIQNLNTGYINKLVSDPMTQTASKHYALQIQELMNNMTLKTKRSISQTYWDNIKNTLSPDIRKSLDELTPEQRWPYLVDSIPQSEREQTLKDIIEHVTKFRTKILNLLQKFLNENIGKIVRFLLVGSTSRYKDMYKMLAQYGRRRGAFEIYWSLIKWKVAVPLIGNTLYALAGPPFKKWFPEFFNDMANWLGIEGFRYDPSEYQSDNAIYNFGINWFNEIIKNPEFVAKEGNALNHFFELEYSDLLPYVSNLISSIVNWWKTNYESGTPPRLPTENDLPNNRDSAVNRFKDTIPKKIIPIENTNSPDSTASSEW